MGWKMVYNFLGIDEKTEKSTYIRAECPYSVFEHPYSVSKQKPRDYPPCLKLLVGLANSVDPGQCCSYTFSHGKVHKYCS